MRRHGPLWNKAPFSPGGAAGVRVEDEGTLLGVFGGLNFTGGGVFVTVGPTGFVTVDIPTGAGIAAGDGLFEGPAGTVNVGANADGSIVVNADDVQLNPALSASIAASAATIAGSGIVATGGFDYLAQTTWFVDSNTGNDANDGATALTPLLTLRELARRLDYHTIVSATDVTLTGTFPTEVLTHNITDYAGITYHAAPTLSANGVVTAFTALAAPATDAKLTDTTTPIVWAARVGQRVRLTSGANAGAIAWVLKDLGANQARVSQFTNPTTGAAVSPAVNDAFAVETLDTVVGGLQCFSLGTGVTKFQSLAVAQIAATGALLHAAGGSPSSIALEGCKLQTNSFIQSFSASAYTVRACCNSSGMFIGKSGTVNVVGHAALGSITVQQSGDVRFNTSSTCFQAVGLTLSLGGYADISAVCGIFDRTGAGASCMSVDTASSLDFSATVFGINNTNTGPGLQVRSGGKAVWSTAGAAPTVTATGGDVIIGGTAAVTYATIAAAPQSAIMNANNGALAGLRA